MDTKSILAYGLYDLLKNKSIDDIRVEKICEYVGLSKKTFYNHFKDKYDLAQYLYDKLVSETISINDYYKKLAKGDEGLNNTDLLSIPILHDIFFVLRSTHKEISSNLVLSNDYNSPQNYFYRQSIQGRKNILLKRLKQAHRHLDQDEIDIAGKILYLISQEYFQRWDSLYDDDLPVEEIKKLIELSNDMIEFFVQRGNDSHFRKL
ncbi:MAG: TetR/AcrR family transcriptional regulator [Longibaculum muris]|uniref:TetR family transcriptional regulator n=1 Tax=Longibaculum muris TaxID=1796628 RepID=A0A4R3YLI8_9FIRM|nr:TetR/AcrR family transcriptional regulator [Longibaculum muris]MBS5369999.1 TetR/AcrR family transcriptional regulator [Coprobacillus cateniformis]MCR1889075.1 TetR/AcrR family transcriptional regulator [Longibaculum muris]MED9811500.1 TetR/AcrR family transcriptional regulator [Longibaculum muris]TCV93120.1 TetR family transcriptional regulator [Longibaculum muris]